MAEPRVKVRGIGRAWTAPDNAVISIEIRRTSQSESAAFEDVASRSKRLEALLRELGIPNEAVHSKNVQLRDEPSYSKGVPAQVTAENEVEVTLRDREAVGLLITAAIRDVDAHVKGLAWELAPENPAHAEALGRAAVNAKEKAEAHASALGVTLGPPIEVSDSEAGGALGYHDRLGQFTLADRSREPAFQIFEGRVPVDAIIDVTFALQPS